ncbi:MULTISPECIES: hypothetical protein [Agrobacterium tumefaciens complex]|uniref:Uncharacterized protein n=1 Tax=Agrobacterium tomkonis CFBP 6623 TaxID=1183432 RepID=A0A1S7PEJ7_9HYPH|nr:MULTISPECIES: hypothetical protein [Agrobacterium tumefaciens complex]QCL88780.1 hypothetical protein CFBP6623_06280 [Agrobacterium tumefaciens]CUX19741.1 hypothetical protein AGR3A_Cc250100 [Agrobacterium tomkonis CFBP 6623]
MRNQKITELLHQYFELGVAEGREGRSYDTEAGDAQRVLSEIEAEIAALSAAEPVAEIVAQRDALIAAGLKCCNGTPNPNLRPFDLAMSFIDSTNTARRAADMLWHEYKAELDALRAAPPVPSVAVKAFQTNKEMIEAFGVDRVREGSRMCFEADGTDTWEDYYEVPFHALARIRSALSAQVQDVAGWQLVPIEPTWEMMRAMFEAMFEASFDGTQAPMVGAGYDAAIAAAPAKQEG